MIPRQCIGPADQHMIGSGQGMGGKHIPDNGAKAAFDTIADYRPAEAFGRGNAISGIGLVIATRMHQQHERGHGHANASIGGEKLGSPRQAADRHCRGVPRSQRVRLRPTAWNDRGHDGRARRRGHPQSPCGRGNRDGGRGRGCWAGRCASWSNFLRETVMKRAAKREAASNEGGARGFGRESQRILRRWPSGQPDISARPKRAMSAAVRVRTDSNGTLLVRA